MLGTEHPHTESPYCVFTVLLVQVCVCVCPTGTTTMCIGVHTQEVYTSLCWGTQRWSLYYCVCVEVHAQMGPHCSFLGCITNGLHVLSGVCVFPSGAW